MRWSLRYQIMLPMAAVMLLAVISVEGVGVVLGVRDTRAQIETQIQEVAQIVEEANFPLTAPVLQQMKALSGAELILVDGAGRMIAASGPFDDVSALSSAVSPHSELGITGSKRVELHNHSYFHSVVLIRARAGGEPARLHILFSEEDYHRAWQREVFPPLGFVAIALPIVLLLSLASHEELN